MNIQNKYQQTLLAVRQHKEGRVGATCPRPATLQERYSGLSAANRNTGMYSEYMNAREYCLKVHEALTQNPNKETAMSKFPTLSGNQAAFMACLLTQPANSVRTDQLAKVLGCVPGAASNIGLQLRALNLVSSTNDNGQYNLWNVTAYAKAMHEEQVRRTANAAQAPVKPKQNQWILWSPESPKPPVVRYSCEQEAMAVAESMAKRYPGQQFLCCEIHAGFKQVKVKREVIKVVEETKMEQC